MPRQFRYLCSLLMLLAIACLFANTSLPAEAATRQIPFTQVKIVHTPQDVCARLIKLYPRLASQANNCNAKIVLTSTWTPNVKVSVSPNACPTGTSSATGTYYGPFHLWYGTERATFSYAGNCSLPSVSFQDCDTGGYHAFPYTDEHSIKCQKFPQGTSNIVAEGSYVASTALYSDYGTVQLIANSNNTGITVSTIGG